MAELTATEQGSGVRRRSPTRRDGLLDVTAHMIATGPIESVTMDSVAAAAGVSRALVYKHFANRHELLASVYERESALLHKELSLAVGNCRSLQDMFHALVEGALAAQAERSATFAALTSQGGRPAGQRNVQRQRDAQTVRYFTQQAVRELGIEPSAATNGVRIALGALSVVLDQWRRQPTSEHAKELADAYVTMAMGGLRALR